MRPPSIIYLFADSDSIREFGLYFSMQKFAREFGGRPLEIEVGKFAQLANGAVSVKYGDSQILATACMAVEPRQGGDFFPLTVEYEEKFSAAGKIKGSRFIKRETRPSDEAMISARLIDRTIRPRFNQKMRNEVQVVITVLSIDDKNDPDIVGLLGASLALSLSDIPWQGPMAGVRVGGIAGDGGKTELSLNPTYDAREKSLFDLVAAGDGKTFNMVEMEGREIPEEETIKAFEFCDDPIRKLIDFQKEIISALNPQKKSIDFPEPDHALLGEVRKFLGEKLEKALFKSAKKERSDELEILRSGLLGHTREKLDDPAKAREAADIFNEEINCIVHEKILKEGKRVDGRKLDELRPISCEAGILARVHGSGLFNRGDTQSLSTLTLGAPGMEQYLDTMELSGRKRFMHHYNFPPFSVGETKPMRGPSRRDIGHGALAEKALKYLLPDTEKFPYTIRVVSEILSSNGSSSMAAVCSSSLALMDAGVPIASPAAGIAMGLMFDRSNGSNKSYRILTDIQGPEDHHGDMDFKIAGTRRGITGMQLDVKIEGIGMDILKDTLVQAKKARYEILDKIGKVLTGPRPNLSPYAPKILVLRISPEKIGLVIGPGGKTINSIIEQTGAEIDIEDDGSVFVTADSEEAAQKTLAIIKTLTKEYKIGEIVSGKVVRILDFGAFVEIGPGQDGMIHISELAPYRVEKVSDVVKIGQQVTAKIINIDDLGRINLSLKQVQKT